jgi:hypothetical protein
MEGWLPEVCNLLSPNTLYAPESDRAMQNKIQVTQTISKYALGLMAFLAELDIFLTCSLTGSNR